MSGKLEKLELRQVIDGKPQGLYIEVSFNPTSLKEEQQVCFRDGKVIGSVRLEKEFTSIPPSLIIFQFTLDGTGANQPPNTEIESVPDTINKIKKITQDYDGESHEPPWVELTWGPNVVRGRTVKLDIEYNLFKPSGEPLRAEVSLEIERSLSRAEETKTKNMNSPDLTHIVSVKAGDTLPLLCHRVYGDAEYYIDVVRHNKLHNFRNLVPGMELEFPPLK